MPYTPAAADELVERLARLQLDRRMRNYRMTDADWARQIAFQRKMKAASPDYLQGRSMVTDAFRHVIDVLESAREMGLTLASLEPTSQMVAGAKTDSASAPKAHVACFDHAYGDRIRVFQTAEAAQAWKEEVAAQGWNDYIPLTVDRPVDPAAAAKAYFDWQAEHANGAQHFSIFECPIENDLTPERPVGYRMALISLEDDMVVGDSSCMEESLFGAPEDPFGLPANAMVCGAAAQALSDWIEEQRRTDASLAQDGVDYRLIGVSAQEARKMDFVPIDELPAPSASYDAPAP